MMKKLNWKNVILTSIVTISPMILGIVFFDKLPDKVAIHWGLHNEPNGWVNRSFFVFGFPVLMMLLQIICQVATTLKKAEDQPLPKVLHIVTWFIPVLSVILYIVTLAVALGHEIDIRKVVCLILGILFIIMGNYFPKISYSNRYLVNMPSHPKQESVWRTFSKIMGVTLMIEGALILISMFFPPVVTIIVLCLMIGLLIGLSFYGTALSKK